MFFSGRTTKRREGVKPPELLRKYNFFIKVKLDERKNLNKYEPQGSSGRGGGVPLDHIIEIEKMYVTVTFSVFFYKHFLYYKTLFPCMMYCYVHVWYIIWSHNVRTRGCFLSYTASNKIKNKLIALENNNNFALFFKKFR